MAAPSRRGASAAVPDLTTAAFSGPTEVSEVPVDDEAGRSLRELAWAAEPMPMSDVRDPNDRLLAAYEPSERSPRACVTERRSYPGIERREPATDQMVE